MSSYNRDEKPTKFYYYIDEFESGYVDDDESVADIDPRKMIAFENLSTDAVQFMEELDEYIHKHVNIKTSVGWFMVACDFTDDTSSEVSINSTDSTDSTIVGNSDDKTIAPVTKPTFSDIVTTSMSTVIDMVSKFVNSSVHGADTPIIDDNDTSGDSTVGDEDVNNDVVNDDDVNNDVNNIKLLTPVDLTN